MKNTDFLVIGSGSAGCVLAAQISRHGGRTVTVVESPVETSQNPGRLRADADRPSHWLRLIGGERDWQYATETQSYLNGRRIAWPRGRGMGGSSQINSMIWYPATGKDFQNLLRASDGKISQTHLYTATEQMESCAQPELAIWVSEATKRFVSATEGMSDGCSTIYRRLTRNGRRWNPAVLLENTSVRFYPGIVNRVLLNDGQAVGVELASGETIRANDQVILCAGAVGSPLVLMRSGIGPAEVLRRVGVESIIDLADVGRNMQDHLVVPVIFSLDSKSRFDLQFSMRDLARWQTVGQGPIGSNIAESGGLFRNDAIQLHVTPTHYLKFPSENATAAMTIAVNATQPESKGDLRITSSDPSVTPVINPNYLAAEIDRETMIRGVRLAREIAEREPLSTWIKGELLPGKKRLSDQSITKVLERYSQTLYHPTSTCAMGKVVDGDFRVHGVERLSVVDASVLPSISVGNPNSLVMTLALLASNKFIK